MVSERGVEGEMVRGCDVRAWRGLKSSREEAGTLKACEMKKEITVRLLHVGKRSVKVVRLQ